ncbi:SPJ_0845 family protein [Paucilactobacillus wasatchensis]|uniref:Uncharacterized protein n=1 Tax=Paucilactobacillus wasatchensis TaxID=1335616 RepID=A0A0D0Y4E7_9LACO|nr:SPJ_0845 family protein [Paucilactobacillus wasatchensis]KIS03138.1 hypothetical protein WDC_1258 [Paucilactobacillus wasatchensis]
MGLIVRRELNLEKLFDDLAVDPKKKAVKQPDKKPNETKQKKNDKKDDDDTK